MRVLQRVSLLAIWTLVVVQIILADSDSSMTFRAFTASDSGLSMDSTGTVSNSTGQAQLTYSDSKGAFANWTAGGLLMSPAATSAACVSFQFSTPQTKVDAFLTTKGDFMGMLSADQDSYDGAKAKPIRGTTFKAVESGQGVANVSVTESYIFAIIDTDKSGSSVGGTARNSSGYVTFAAHPIGSSVCRLANVSAPGAVNQQAGAALAVSAPAPRLAAVTPGSPSAAPPAVVPYMADDLWFRSGDLLAPALITNVTCAAFQLLGAKDVTHNMTATAYLTTAVDLLGYINQLDAGNYDAELPGSISPVCEQSQPGNNNTNFTAPADATVSLGVTATNNLFPADSFNVTSGEVDFLQLNATQGCQIAVNNLDRNLSYVLLMQAIVPTGKAFEVDTTTLTLSRIRYTALSQGNCSNIAFGPTANATAVAVYKLRASELEDHTLFSQGINIDSAVTGASGSSGGGGLSGGAIAGIVIGALLGVILLFVIGGFMTIGLAGCANVRHHKRGLLPSVSNRLAKGSHSDMEMADNLEISKEPFFDGRAYTKPPLSPFKGDPSDSESSELVLAPRAVDPRVWAKYMDAHRQQASLFDARLLSKGSIEKGSVGAQPELPILPPSNPKDWEWDSKDVDIVKTPEGSDVVLGLGAFGPVKKAKLYKTHTVAVKEVHDVPEVETAALNRKISHVLTYRHQNIVQLTAACFQEDKLLLIMEYCPGGSLREARQSEKWKHMTQERKMNIAIDIAMGLHYLHWRKDVHRNLHSGNVLLTHSAAAKIGGIGFWPPDESPHCEGIQRLKSRNASWRAPELGERLGSYSEAADMYGLGACLYELFSGEGIEELDNHELRCPQDCSIAVRDFIKACLSKDTNERPTAQDAVELLRAEQPRKIS